MRATDVTACLQILTMLMSTSMAGQISNTETQQSMSAWDDHRWLGLLFAEDTNTADTVLDATSGMTNDIVNHAGNTITSMAEAIFAAIYRILLDMARHQRATLLDVVPLFNAQVNGLMHCLRAPRLNATIEQMEKFYHQLAFPLVSRHAPLSVSCAHWTARLLSALVDRGAIQAGNRDTTTTTTTSNTTTSHYQRAIGKHAPYLLASWLAMELDTHSELPTSTRTALQPGIFALFDLCTEHERHYLQASTDAAGRARLKDVYRDYMSYHKYTGKA
ncbi:Urb2/Npa2 family-domain-containing protein [Syncephalis plumigaleata]|nr:Urb2/Npa2 family-domain-containing protein [Syncephalis plumigaleata]